MEVQFAPDLQAKLDRLSMETGPRAEELVRDAVSIYLDRLADTRAILESRYDDLKCGKVKLIGGDRVIARFPEKIASRRAQHAWLEHLGITFLALHANHQGSSETLASSQMIFIDPASFSQTGVGFPKSV
jgi:hypothetical protein